MRKTNIDYVELMKEVNHAKNDPDLLQNALNKCISLANEYPQWNWRQAPKTKVKTVLDAHTALVQFLETQGFFDQLVQRNRLPVSTDSFMEIWEKRGATTPVTSDHTMITSSFDLLSHELLKDGKEKEVKKFTLLISTWNLMNKAHSQKSHNQNLFANNPEDLDESDEDFRQRKTEQIKQIIDHIKLSDPAAIFLQEIDFLTNPQYSDLKKSFVDQLNNSGFEILITSREPGCIPQAIIYNTKHLTLNSKKPTKTLMPGTEVGGKKNKNTLFEAHFIHNPTKQKVCLISAHLDYEGKYGYHLWNYAADVARGNELVVYGGDTNHAPGNGIHGITGDFNHATNYDVTPTSEGTSPGTHIVHHGIKAKAYDGFGFCPPPGHRIRSMEKESLRFYIDTNNKVSIKPFLSEFPTHKSLKGYGWMRRQDMVLDYLQYRDQIKTALLALLKTETPNEEDKKIIEEIINQDEVIKIKDSLTAKGYQSDLLTQLIKEAERLVNDKETSFLQKAMDEYDPILEHQDAPKKSTAVPLQQNSELDKKLVAVFNEKRKGEKFESIEKIVENANSSGVKPFIGSAPGERTREALKSFNIISSDKLIPGKITEEVVRYVLTQALKHNPKITPYQRIKVLDDTIKALENKPDRDRHHADAKKNHENWKKNKKAHTQPTVRVIEGDWGEVTLNASRGNGEIYAVLNMANAISPGGGYLEGMVAQEENMFRRTDCHFSITPQMTEKYKERVFYTKEFQNQINGVNGEVLLDKRNPRVCIKGKEDPLASNNVGYLPLQNDEKFEFYELRSAADDLRSLNDQPIPFNEKSMRQKIGAQLDTLIKENVRHVVLSAFGCGAFLNPPEQVASIYREELEKRAGQFDDVVFAIYYAGYGPRDNYEKFHKELDGLPLTVTVTPSPGLGR